MGDFDKMNDTEFDAFWKEFTGKSRIEPLCKVEQVKVQEFEFDGFSIVIEGGKPSIQYEDAEDGLVSEELAGEDGKIEFPVTILDAEGIERVFTEDDYNRIQGFLGKK
jgi:hypothetical protein